MQAIPAAVQRHLDAGLRLQRGRVWPWGVQLYEDDPRFHYEVARAPLRVGERLELGLHFESRNSVENRAWLAGMTGHLIEIKAALGDGIEAEPWDRGWTKVYETIPLASYDEIYLEVVARRLAEIVHVLHPIYRGLR